MQSTHKPGKPRVCSPFGDHHDHHDSKCQVQRTSSQVCAPHGSFFQPSSPGQLSIKTCSCFIHVCVTSYVEASVDLAEECHQLRLVGLEYQSTTHCSPPWKVDGLYSHMAHKLNPRLLKAQAPSACSQCLPDYFRSSKNHRVHCLTEMRREAVSSQIHDRVLWMPQFSHTTSLRHEASWRKEGSATLSKEKKIWEDWLVSLHSQS